VEAVAAVLHDAPTAAPRLTLGRALGLPLKRPRVLTAAIVDHDGTLAELQERVKPRARRPRPVRAGGSGRSAPRRPWPGCGPDARAAGAKMPGPAPVTFYGEALTLYRSQLRREGARYEPLVRVPATRVVQRPSGRPGFGLSSPR
jgi:hypothetical protein